ncbi:MAG: hypothetical protein MK103_16860 [Planctomycetes bacterium]|nr:hypothetical protein [Planctomycetota bacterium]
MPQRQKQRAVEILIREGLYPASEFDPEVQGWRYQAIAEILCTIPEEDYRALLDLRETFEWFVPHIQDLGKVCRFENTKMDRIQVVYLSPALEHEPWGLVVVTVACALADILCGPSETAKKKTAIDDRIKVWGLSEEFKACRNIIESVKQLEESDAWWCQWVDT